MLENLREQIDILVNLQEIEIETDKSKALVNALPEKIALFDAEVLEYENSIKEKETLLDEIKKKYRDRETDAQTNRTMIAKSREKQMAAKTNKEYHSTLVEIEKLEKINSDIEEEMLEYLDKIELMEKEIKADREKYEEIKENAETEKKTIQQEAKVKEERVRELEAEWKNVSGKVDSSLLNTYNKVRKQLTRGVAIVPVQNAVCHGCNVNIPPQMYNELQRCDSLKMCPNCQRIIYWANEQ